MSIKYYEERKKAINNLDEIVKKSNQVLSVTGLVYEITRLYAISNKLIQERLKMLADMGFIKIEGDNLIPMNTSVSKPKLGDELVSQN